MEQHPIHILLIEKDKSTKELIESSIRTFGERYSLISAGSIKEAFSHLEKFTPDILISDFILPDGKIYELVKKIDKEFPILIITEIECEDCFIKEVNSSKVRAIGRNSITSCSFPHVVDDLLDSWNMIVQQREIEQAIKETEKELWLMNKIWSVFIEHSDNEMYVKVLDLILEVMMSKTGIFGYIDSGGDLICPSMTKNVLQECNMPNKDIRIPRKVWGGIWGKALIEKKVQMTNEVCKVPKGHLPINNVIAAPIVYQDELIGLLMVGNKEGAYSESDKRFLGRIASLISPVLSARLKQQEIETKRRETQLALEKSEVRYKELFENAGDAIIWFDSRDGRIINCNRAAELLFERTREELVGLNHSSLFPSDKGQIYVDAFTQNSQSCSMVIDEAKVVSKSGKVKMASITYTRTDEKSGELIQGILHDITERKIAEEELRNSKQILQIILDSLPDGLLIVNAEGWVIKDCNSSALEILKCRKEDIIGKSIDLIYSLIVDPLGADQLRSQINGELKNRGTINQFGCKMYRHNKEIFHSEINIVALMGPNGRHSIYCVMFRDVTEKKMSEMKLAQDEKLKSIGQLAAGIAHEINTPTQFINDNTHYLQKGVQDLFGLIEKYQNLIETVKTDEKYAKIVDEISSLEKEIDLEFLEEDIPKAIEQSIEGLSRVTKIVKAMKDFAHPEIGEKVSANINQIIENTVTVSRNEWKYVSDVSLDLDPNLPSVDCLPGEIGQVILNMIVNAAHAIADAQKQNQSQEKGTIKITTRSDGEFVEISISDTGAGIPDEIRGRLFEPFFTTKEVGKGTGQGLFIARTVVVEKHGGSITFDSEVGKGTTFFIKLPLKGEEMINGSKSEEKDFVCRR